MTKRDELTKRVMEKLVAVWPEQMLAPTGSGMQWGQLVAIAAVTALENELPLTDRLEEQFR